MAENELKEVIVLYPNLVEEIRIRKGEYRHTLVRRILKAANITGELLAAAIADGEKLSGYELFCVAQELGHPVEYIKSKKLKMFNANKADKAAYIAFKNNADRLTNLKNYVENNGGKTTGWCLQYHYQNVMSFYEAISENGITSYAHYLLAQGSIKIADDLIGSEIRMISKAKQPPPRGVTRQIATVNA